MGFAGIFMIIILWALLSGAVALIIFIVALIQKKKNGKSKIILNILVCFFSAPLALLITAAVTYSVYKKYTGMHSLAYCVMNDDFRQAEKLLKKGVSPDCTLKSNAPAQNGEATLLCILCEKGFVDLNYESSLYDQDSNEVLKMAELLIRYNADVNYRYYNSEHESHDSTDYYDMFKASDDCGRTPFLFAAEMENSEMIDLLVKNGADVNAVDYTGYNAISIIADEGRGNIDILKKFVDLGVKIPEKSRLGQDYAFFVFRNQSIENKDEYIKTINSASPYGKAGNKSDVFTGYWEYEETSVIIKHESADYDAIIYDKSTGAYICWEYPLKYNDGKLICAAEGHMYDGLDTGSKYSKELKSECSTEFSLSENKLVWNDSSGVYLVLSAK